MKFFDKNFWQLLVVGTLSSLATLMIAFIVSMYLSDKIEKLTTLFESVDRSVQSISKLVNTDPEKVKAMSDTLNTSVEELGESVGKGSVSAIERARDSWLNYRNEENE